MTDRVLAELAELRHNLGVVMKASVEIMRTVNLTNEFVARLLDTMQAAPDSPLSDAIETLAAQQAGLCEGIDRLREKVEELPEKLRPERVN